MKQLYRLFWTIDLSALRFTTAIGSMLWSLMLFWPGNTFIRPTYDIMGSMMTEFQWAASFFLHSCLLFSSLVSGERNKYLEFFETSLGCFLWTGSCIAMLNSVYPPPAAISAEIAVAFSSWWALCRVNFSLNNDKNKNNGIR